MRRTSRAAHREARVPVAATLRARAAEGSASHLSGKRFAAPVFLRSGWVMLVILIVKKRGVRGSCSYTEN